MRAVGEVVPALVGAGGGAAPAEARVAAPLMRGEEVVLPALPAPLPRLPPAMATRLRLDLAPDGNAVATGEVIQDRVGDEVLVVERPYRPPVRGVPAAWHEAVAEPVERLRRILGTVADERTIWAWVQRWALGLANPPTKAEAAQRFDVLLLGLRDVPAIAFTVDSAALVLHRFKFWPAVKEVFDLCEEVVRPHRDMLRVLERWKTMPPDTGPAREAPPDDRPRRTAPKTPEEIAAVHAIAATVMAEAKAREVSAGGDAPGIGGAWTAARSGELSLAERKMAEGGPDRARWEARVRALRVERDRLMQQPMPGVALVRGVAAAAGAPVASSGPSARPAECEPVMSEGPKAEVWA